MSLGRFQNCNSLKMDNFRHHGVEDVYQSNLLVPADLAAGDYDLAITVSGASSLPAKVSVGGK